MPLLDFFSKGVVVGECHSLLDHPHTNLVDRVQVKPIHLVTTNNLVGHAQAKPISLTQIINFPDDNIQDFGLMTLPFSLVIFAGVSFFITNEAWGSYVAYFDVATSYYTFYVNY